MKNVSSGSRWRDIDARLDLIWDIPVPVLVVDQESLAFLDANRCALDAYGYSLDELRQMGVGHPKLSIDPESARAFAQRIRDSDNPIIGGPFQTRTANGSLRTDEVVLVPRTFDGRKISIAILKDVTEARRAEERYHTLFTSFPLPLIIYDPDSLRFLEVNEAASEEFGYSREEFLNMSLPDLQPVPSSGETTSKIISRQHGQRRYQKKDGSFVDVEVSSDDVSFGTRTARILVARDVTALLHQERAAELALSRLDEAQAIAHLGSFTFDFPTRMARYGSVEMLRILGLTETDPGCDTDIAHWFFPEDVERVLDIARSSGPQGEFVAETRLRRADGRVIWVRIHGKTVFDEAGNAVSASGAIYDIDEQVRAEQYLQFAAYHDPLTSLPNRTALVNALEDAMDMGHAAVCYLDFDGFSEINDSFGHSFGDEILKLIARRLESGLEGAQRVFRWGGDEFVIVIPLRDSLDSFKAVLTSVRSELEPAYSLGGREVFITPSIGISLYPEHGPTAEDLIRSADTAMYEAKRHKNASAVFAPSMYAAAANRRKIQNGLHQAIRLNKLVLSFQPIVAANDGRLIEAEALLRWVDPEVGVRFPDEFIDVAESSGLIVPIGEWVIEETCRSIATFRENCIDIPVGINISCKQFETGNLLALLSDSMNRYGIDPSLIVVEITETGLMRDIESSIGLMNQLHAAGIRIAMDDFGTGYSSLAYLKRFPLDILKTDGVLLKDLQSSDQDRAIISAIIELARATKLELIAEGVETSDQADLLRSMGCDAFQGYYFSEPLDVQDFIGFARRTRN